MTSTGVSAGGPVRLGIIVGARNAIGYTDKVIELALILLLLLEARRPPW